MINYQDIAKKYAERHGYDIVHTSAEKNGYQYFYIERSQRSRYMGHPHIIKVSPVGKIYQVLKVEEIYWAYKQTKASVQSLL